MPPRTTDATTTGRPAGGHAPADDERRAELLRHLPVMWRLTRRYFRQPADREDALQDALLAAVRGLAGFEWRCRLGTWLHRLTVNACLMKLRSDGRRERAARATGRDAPADGPTPLDAMQQSERAVAVAAVVDALPAASRSVLVLRLAGHDVAGCAAVLGVSPDVVKVRCHRARAAVRKKLHHLAG